MKLFNPCNKCLIKVCCSKECQDYYLHTVTMNQLLYIPREINSFMKKVYKEIKFCFKDEPTFIKLWLSLLFTCWIFSLCLLLGLAIALIKVIIS